MSEIVQVKIKEPWFSYIKMGVKKVEGRVCCDEWANLEDGQYLLIIDPESNKSFTAKIIKIRNYDDIDTYIMAESLENILPEVSNVNIARQIYLQWCPENEIKQYGFKSVELQVIKTEV